MGGLSQPHPSPEPGPRTGPPIDRRPRLGTERLRLDPLVPGHVDLLVDLDGDPEVMRYLTGRALTRDEVVGTVVSERLRPGPIARGLGYWVGFSAGSFVGWWALQPDDEDDDAAELGYRLRRAAWGGGLATEGARALVDHAFDGLGLTRVWAETMAVNTRSRRVLEKLGLRHVATEQRTWEEPLPGAEQGEVRYELRRPSS